MDTDTLKKLLEEQFKIMDAACAVYRESQPRVEKILTKKSDALTIGERESCEALTASIEWKSEV